MLPVDVLARVSLETARICFPTIVDGRRGHVDPRLCDRRLGVWAGGVLRAANVQLETEGVEHLVPGESYVVMSNHQSHFDIPVLFCALGISIRMVAKTELFSIPIMGVAMRYAGFVEIDRSKKTRALKSLSYARERLKRDKTSVWISPEGTRSATGELGDFKRGGFYMAMDAGLRILPVSIDGSVEIHRTQEWAVHKNRCVRVKVSPPIDPKDYPRRKVGDLVEAVRSTIAGGLSVRPS